MTVLDYVKDLLKKCPVISLDGVQTDNANETEMLYSISQEPVNPIVRQYTRGEALKQFSFHLFCWKSSFTDAARDENYRNYEALAEWFKSITFHRDFPSMGERREARAVKIQGNPYEHDKSEDADAALYGMQCVLNYFEKGEL